MSERKCFCGEYGEVTNLNGYRVYLCNGCHNVWVEQNREYVSMKARVYQRGLFEYGKDWYEKRVKAFEEE